MAEFVLGCVQLGLAYGAANRTGKPSAEATSALLSRALAAGIRVFDAARAYGDAEARLGDILANSPATIITKLAPLAELNESSAPDEAVAAAERSVRTSLETLRRPHLDVLLLHRAAHRTAFGGAIWKRLLAYQKEGVIGRLGVSVQTPGEARDALGDGTVGHIQLPFNLLDWRWTNILGRFDHRPDVTLHVRSIFLQGLLAAGNPAFWPPIAGVDAQAVTAELSAAAQALERESPADLCLAFVRGHRQIHGVVIGLETVAQLERNLSLFAKPALTPEQCAALAARLPRLPEQLLNPALWPK